MKYLASFILLLFLTISPENLQAQWTQTKGPGGGAINCMAVNGDTVYAGTDNGLFVSTNNGLSWSMVVLQKVNCIAVKDNVILTSSESSLFLSITMEFHGHQ